MFTKTKELVRIASEEDIVQVRSVTKRTAVFIGLSLVNQTKVVTAASELARNTLDYGLGGTVQVEVLELAGKTGMRLKFEDHGPGIPNIKQALSDGFTSGKGMGLGLGGSKRLVDEFELSSVAGEGTVITITKWT